MTIAVVPPAYNEILDMDRKLRAYELPEIFTDEKMNSDVVDPRPRIHANVLEVFRGIS